MATAVLFPYNEEFNPFLILILSLLMAEGFYRLPLRYSIANGAIDAFGLGITALNSNLDLFIQVSIAIYLLFLFIALIHYKKS
ncbi:hypothetical protein [Bacillus sp. J33]|uniref:hypothetical protein n=1 Tax=Bacillus sp. J33 TaxID=935836 RepID=UPI00047B23A8|nr:hypothetical protein [Bacillus sp. J33]